MNEIKAVTPAPPVQASSIGYSPVVKNSSEAAPKPTGALIYEIWKGADVWPRFKWLARA